MHLHWSHAGLLRRLMTQEVFPYDATSNLLTHLGADEPPASQPKISWKDCVPRMGFQIETIIRGSNFAVLYMLAVIFSALRWGGGRRSLVPSRERYRSPSSLSLRTEALPSLTSGI